MRRVLGSVVLLVALVCAVSAYGASSGEPQTITISSIRAAFKPADFLTEYSIERRHFGTPRPVTVSWSLQLELVDKAGAPSPGTADSGAAVDIGCTNDGVGTPKPQTAEIQPGHSTPRFQWHHPDAVASRPPGRYHCDHQDMGPHGHQGLIRVTVTDGLWTCTATYKGTNSSTAESARDGTASEPKCHPVKR